MIELNLTVIIQLVIVLSLMGILTQIVFKPFLTVLQERKNRIDGAEQRARELQQQADELVERYREAIAAAQAQGATIRDEIRKTSLAEEMAILQKAMEAGQSGDSGDQGKNRRGCASRQGRFAVPSPESFPPDHGKNSGEERAMRTKRIPRLRFVFGLSFAFLVLTTADLWAGEGKGGFSSEVVWQILSFVLLLVLLIRFVKKPLVSFLAHRQEEIQRALEQSAKKRRKRKRF